MSYQHYLFHNYDIILLDLAFSFCPGHELSIDTKFINRPIGEALSNLLIFKVKKKGLTSASNSVHGNKILL